MERRFADLEAKLERKGSENDARIRELEKTRSRKLEGKVTGALAQGIATVVLKKHNDGSLADALLSQDARANDENDEAD